MSTKKNIPALPISKKLTIGLFGFGVVGKGLYEVLQSTPALQAGIKTICIKNADKKRSIPAEHFTTDPRAILEDEEINVVVELIDDADAAYSIVKEALQKGKAVVSANKKMIAAHFEELLRLQFEHEAAFLYEGSCCASIPIIRNLEEYYDNDLLSSVKGIVNGSTNFILTKIFEEGLSFKDALLQAQQLGFAESNPALDIEGHDAANKLSILLAHGFGTITKPTEILYNGITPIKETDAEVAKQKNLQIKLVATARKINDTQLAAFVLPQFVAADDELANVNNEFNGLITESSFADKHFFKGRGAGAYPTAAAVLSDIAALRYNYKYEYKKYLQQSGISLTNDFYLKVFVSATDINLIEKDEFEWLEEWHNESNNSWVVGIIHAQKLFSGNWWKETGVSLILTENPIVENVDYRKIGKKSLALAGVL
ncbi:homoserine dehydrogenase [Ferruginibacter sp. HRS2-29]|uniref:homoserine dehydrogenase n=1 Tax=Ferruginibacter sp. HRS2-29 TaxID=2487334 RepID=UPI0020CC22B6|nr:homoserine dehydrogenase [Ferruginibacter sp. HRS2-29]MCP9751834.1 homoserine dehydrogenase [Ferruginibacter sp. HRS2-29]